MMHRDDRTEADAATDLILNGTGDSYALFHRQHHRDGHWIWVYESGVVIARDASGKPLKMLGLNINLSAAAGGNTQDFLDSASQHQNDVA